MVAAGVRMRVKMVMFVRDCKRCRAASLDSPLAFWRCGTNAAL
jgi:hypothetical protein